MLIEIKVLDNAIKEYEVQLERLEIERRELEDLQNDIKNGLIENGKRNLNIIGRIEALNGMKNEELAKNGAPIEVDQHTHVVQFNTSRRSMEGTLNKYHHMLTVQTVTRKE